MPSEKAVEIAMRLYFENIGRELKPGINPNHLSKDGRECVLREAGIIDDAIAELVEAGRPFAKVVEMCGTRPKDKTTFATIRTRGETFILTVGAFRRLAAALEAFEKKE